MGFERMILSHETIKFLVEEKELTIKPLFLDTIRENGVDLRVGREYYMKEKIERTDGEIQIPPKEFAILTTKEVIELPDNIVGFCNLRSTWARRGLLIPPTVVDAGFRGILNIEIFNATNSLISLPVGERFLHVVFDHLDRATTHTYRGKYQNQRGVVL